MNQEQIDLRYQIQVNVKTQYLDEQSDPEQSRFVFAYTVTINNNGTLAAQLLSRHWLITDGNQKTQEVIGEGVVGEKPLIQPGDSFEYTSGTVINTQVGSMHGNYQMIGSDGHLFNAVIEPFTLALPHALH